GDAPGADRARPRDRIADGPGPSLGPRSHGRAHRFLGSPGGRRSPDRRVPPHHRRRTAEHRDRPAARVGGGALDPPPRGDGPMTPPRALAPVPIVAALAALTAGLTVFLLILGGVPTKRSGIRPRPRPVDRRRPAPAVPSAPVRAAASVIT